MVPSLTMGGYCNSYYVKTVQVREYKLVVIMVCPKNRSLFQQVYLIENFFNLLLKQ